MKKNASKSPPEISIALRYIIKSSALLAHHKHLRPGDLTIHIPIINFTIPTPALEFVHGFIGLVFLAFWIEINIRGILKIRDWIREFMNRRKEKKL